VLIPKSEELRALAQQIANAFPPEVVEVVLTGSVSRGVADEVSDIEMLVVTVGQPVKEWCFEHCALEGDLGSWGAQDTPSVRVSGYRDGVPIEEIWWSQAFAEQQIAAFVSAEAIANGVPLRTSGLLERWQAKLAEYPDELAAARIEEAALTWGGFAPAGFLTVTRPGERFALVERLVDDAQRVCKIVFALNRVWEPTHKRLTARVEALAIKPERLAERITEALSEPDATHAVRTLTQLQIDTVALAPSGPNVDRAREWLPRVLEVLE
jgi:predicted nucleotidyltransferase